MLASKEDWHTPGPVHLAACPSQHNSGSPGPWCVSVNITFLVTLEQKTCFGVSGGKFQALATEERRCVLFYTDSFENGSGRLHGLLIHPWDFDGQEYKTGLPECALHSKLFSTYSQ